MTVYAATTEYQDIIHGTTADTVDECVDLAIVWVNAQLSSMRPPVTNQAELLKTGVCIAEICTKRYVLGFRAGEEPVK